VRVAKRKNHITFTTVTFLHFVMHVLMFCDVYVLDYYVLKLLHLETITFSDATLSDINAVLCYVLSKYRFFVYILLHQAMKLKFKQSNCVINSMI
jgi:hypothetical protein